MAKSKMMKVIEPSGDGEVHVALYSRVSTDAQAEEGYSIDIQKAKTRSFVDSLPVAPTSITDYVDDGYSGASLDRPRIQDLMTDVKEGRITHVIVYKLDRISRSQKDTLFLIEDIFIPNNVTFISVQESFNTSTPFGRAVIGILSVFAQFERENIYERTRSGMKKRVEAGYWMGGGTVPFGYDYDPSKGILIPNENAETVKLIYQLYIQGYSEDMIAKKVSLKYDRLVHQILVRKSNTGVIVYNGEEYPGRHDAIIDLETYNTAMEIMKERSKKKLVAKTPHLLTGLLECGICGAKMRYQKWSKGAVKIVCYSKQTSKPYLVKDPNCSSKPINKDIIEEVVLNDIFEMTGSLASSGEISYNKTLLETLENQEQTLHKKINKLYALYAAEDDNEYILETIDGLKEEHQELLEKIEKERENESQYKRAIQKSEQLKNLKDIWEYMDHNEQMAVIRSIVDKIIILEDEITVKYKI